jgi:5-methylcytosine-specific restriction enzyme A
MRQLRTGHAETARRKELYNSEPWRRLRRDFLRHHPNCESCGGQAKVLDHLLGHSGDWEARFWSGPFQALCESCHNTKTNQERVDRERDWKPLNRRLWRTMSKG